MPLGWTRRLAEACVMWLWTTTWSMLWICVKSVEKLQTRMKWLHFGLWLQDAHNGLQGIAVPWPLPLWLINGVLCQQLRNRYASGGKCGISALTYLKANITQPIVCGCVQMVSVALLMANTTQMRFFIKKSEPNSIKMTRAVQKQSSLKISRCPRAANQAHPSSVHGMWRSEMLTSEKMDKIRVELDVVEKPQISHSKPKLAFKDLELPSKIYTEVL